MRPQDLPGRLADAGADADGNGNGNGATLDDAPLTPDEARRRSLGGGRREFSSYDDRAVMAVGGAGSGWSFAFDGDPAYFDSRRFVSPAAAASTGARAVVVWSGLRDWRGAPFFHLSVAEDGCEQYAFTYADGAVSRTGAVPEVLDPDRFFGSGSGQEAGEAERGLLEALTRVFGVRLPRHALTHGRLHRFTSRSWTRPPGEGEAYSVVIWSRGTGEYEDS